MINPSTYNGKKARNDYQHEFANFFQLSPKWDDSSNNTGVVGDMFAFVHQIANRIEHFRVIDVLRSNYRPEEWNITEDNNRNVLMLSHKF